MMPNVNCILLISRILHPLWFLSLLTRIPSRNKELLLSRSFWTTLLNTNVKQPCFVSHAPQDNSFRMNTAQCLLTFHSKIRSKLQNRTENASHSHVWGTCMSRKCRRQSRNWPLDISTNQPINSNIPYQCMGAEHSLLPFWTTTSKDLYHKLKLLIRYTIWYKINYHLIDKSCHVELKSAKQNWGKWELMPMSHFYYAACIKYPLTH